GHAKVYGEAEVCGHTYVYGDSKVYENAIVSGMAAVLGNAWVHGNAKVYDLARVDEDVEVCGDVEICEHARIFGAARLTGDAVVRENYDYIVFKNWWSSGRYFTWTRSNDIWRVGCFHGTGKELIARAYKDSKLSGRNYERIVNYVNSIKKEINQLEKGKFSPNFLYLPKTHHHENRLLLLLRRLLSD
ncbi:MAG: hypothetical protein Q4E59_00580, partial [Bacteroidales bacterium]|nr:hypothetical protein [Bacteroidales bacterium]